MKILRKKMFRVLLMAAVVFTAVSFAGFVAPADVHAAYYNDYAYTVKNGNAIILDYSGTDTDLTLPETINGHPVTGIGEEAFWGCKSLTSMTIPGSVKNIGTSAFAYCDALTSVKISNGVTNIGKEAFAYCSALTRITIPNSVESIGENAFFNCSSLTGITVASGNKAYDSRGNCNAIIKKSNNALIVGCKNTKIPSGVKSIGDWAFAYCKSLTSMTIPGSVKNIGKSAFEECDALTSVKISDGVTSIGEHAFLDCSSLTSITIPGSVETIENAAFHRCSSLTSITIPGSVKTIEPWAFASCKSLTRITIPGSVKTIRTWAFAYCKSLTSITIPGSVKTIDDGAFAYCKSLTRITIPDSVTSIRGGAFHGCSSLTSITIPGSVKTIEDWTFCGCSSLTNVKIPKGVTSIGEHAFMDCSSLTSITIPGSVKNIGDGAFEDCSSLTSITIPYGVKNIADDTFTGCKNLTIYGEYNSEAQVHAKCRNIPFVVAVLTQAKLSPTKYVYNGKARKPSVKVPGLVYNTDFAVSYANNVKVGKATVTIKGKGIHAGTLKKTFKIVPKKAAIAKLKPGKASLTVKASTKPSVKGAAAYQIAYKQKGTSKWRYTKTKNQTKTVRNLKKGKRYYVKVRAYRKVSNVKYCGAWSKIKLSSKIR